MWKSALFKLVLILLLFLTYFQGISAHDLGLISKSRWNNSPANSNGQSKMEIVDGQKVELVVAEEISCWEKNGKWETLKVCPQSKIVTGHRFRYLSRTGLTGIELKCTPKYGRDETEKEEILHMTSEPKENLPRGKWGKWKNKSRSAFAEGFSFNRGELSLRRSVENYNVIYHSRNQAKTEKQPTGDVGKVYTKCPVDHAICGVTAMMDKAELGILTALGLKCCFHCFPEEKWVTVHHFNNTAEEEKEQTVNTTVGLNWNLKKSADYTEISNAVVQDGFSTRFGKFRTNSKSAGFDWSGLSFSFWWKETALRKTHVCQAKRSCVFKQLVGQCGSVRVPVDNFCEVSVPTGSSIPDSCKAILDFHPFANCSDGNKNTPSAKQKIYPYGNNSRNSKSLEVLCDFEADGGGWTIIQKRSSGAKHEFVQNWAAYSNGFGSLDKNFWLGLENIHTLTQNGDQELRIELEDFEGEKRWAKYSSFSISDASDFYRLSVDGFSGDAGNDMNYARAARVLNGMQFSTFDKDNDQNPGKNCAAIYPGGWWFNDCQVANLNGLYRANGEKVPYYKGIIWRSWKRSDYSLAKTEMKIRTRK